MYYSTKRRPELKEQHPDWPFGDYAMAIGAEWGQMSEKEKSTYQKKADKDKNEVIDFEEFVKETPKVLRVNLVKLAKQNGHDLGFLV